MQYAEENETLKDKSPCAGVRADLKMCLLKSECCQIVSDSTKCNYFMLNFGFSATKNT